MRIISLFLAVIAVISSVDAVKESDGNQRTPYIQNLKFSKMASFNPTMIEPGTGGNPFPSPFGEPSAAQGGAQQPSAQDPSGKAQQMRGRVKRQTNTANQISKMQILAILHDIIEKQRAVARDTAEVVKVLKIIGVPDDEALNDNNKNTNNKNNDGNNINKDNSDKGNDMMNVSPSAGGGISDLESKDNLKLFLAKQLGKYVKQQRAGDGEVNIVTGTNADAFRTVSNEPEKERLLRLDSRE